MHKAGTENRPEYKVWAGYGMSMNGWEKKWSYGTWDYYPFETHIDGHYLIIEVSTFMILILHF